MKSESGFSFVMASQPFKNGLLPTRNTSFKKSLMQNSSWLDEKVSFHFGTENGEEHWKKTENTLYKDQ